MSIKHKLTFGMFLGLFALILLKPSLVRAALPRDVVFYEIMWAGSSVSSDDEWFVLKNTTANEINIDGWQVTYLSSGIEKEMVSLAGKIASGGYYLTSNYKADNAKSVLNITPDQDDTIVSLNNDKLQLKLYDGEFTSGASVIDTAGDGKKPLAGSSTAPRASMVRNDLIDNGAVATSWHTNTAQCNLDVGATELATPQSSVEDTKCHPPGIEMLNKLPKALKVGETFTAQLKISDEIDSTVSGGVDGGNEEWAVGEIILQDIKCDTVGEKEIKITATDSKLSIARLDETVQCYDSGVVVINEIMPTPKVTDYDQSGTIDSKDEWVELYNPEARPINLAGWWLGDKAKPQKYQLDANAIINPKGFLTITHRQSGIALNDDGEEVYLYDPSGLLIDRVAYGKGHDDAGWARFDTGFEWTLAPTYNSQNIKSPIDQDVGGAGGPTLPDEAPSTLTTETVVEPTEVVTYKITTTKTTKPPSYASLPVQYLSEVPVANFFEQTNSLAKSINQYVVSQMIIGLVGLLSLARVSYNVLCLLL